MKVAVIGAGISGMSAAWLLSKRHQVTLFERDRRLGGHSNTVDVAAPEGTIPIDTGFIVYNLASYPNLIALFDHLQVKTAPTNMSFAVSADAGAYEYSGSGLNGLFGQRRNLARPGHWRMAADIFRFLRAAQALDIKGGDATLSLGDWLSAGRFSEAFVKRHILPMGAAIWSTPADEMLDFPALAFARFFANHGLLQAFGGPQWRTVQGGSREYVSRLIAEYRGEVISADAAQAVMRSGQGVTVRTSSGARLAFDRCLLACHGDEALRLLADADDHEQSLLSKFRYAKNETILHRDPAFMPKRRRVWSAWNYLSNHDGRDLSVTYWMNKLQPLPTSTNYFVTLNPRTPIADHLVERRFTYTHPMFDAAALSAQKKLWSLQGRRNTWFAGSYFGSGFHEDGLQAGLAAAEHLGGVRRPWTVENESARIHLPVDGVVPAVRMAAE